MIIAASQWISGLHKPFYWLWIVQSTFIFGRSLRAGFRAAHRARQAVSPLLASIPNAIEAKKNGPDRAASGQAFCQ
ncbi:TPA: hypothetical protein HMV26_24350 [Escherichia coli]|nr:hypothetical protein [Escherichia coli]